MPRTIPESDWKLFRKFQAVALERYCERVLGEIESLAADKTNSAHQRYLAIYSHIHNKDEELALAFNNPRRSTAYQQLIMLHRLKLITVDEFQQFSSETREVVTLIAKT